MTCLNMPISLVNFLCFVAYWRLLAVLFPCADFVTEMFCKLRNIDNWSVLMTFWSVLQNYSLLFMTIIFLSFDLFSFLSVL